ncbi:MAG: DUF4250 domain-containing protein [Hespellia sp.]|nr:DUF4250 domain-containing protein [Hespellia sp.]
MQTELPKDPVMLLSVINTKLRDYYPSFEKMCEEMQLDSVQIIKVLERIDYRYDEGKNQFI